MEKESDYEQHRIQEDNIGFQMLKKAGWSEGVGLGDGGKCRDDCVCVFFNVIFYKRFFVPLFLPVTAFTHIAPYTPYLPLHLPLIPTFPLPSHHLTSRPSSLTFCTCSPCGHSPSPPQHDGTGDGDSRARYES